MQSRIDSQKVAPGGFRAMLALENYVRNSSGLEPSLLELVTIRASQINGYLTVEGEYVMKMRSTQGGDR
jgi:hypothetical protein